MLSISAKNAPNIYKKELQAKQIANDVSALSVQLYDPFTKERINAIKRLNGFSRTPSRLTR